MKNNEKESWKLEEATYAPMPVKRYVSESRPWNQEVEETSKQEENYDELNKVLEENGYPKVITGEELKQLVKDDLGGALGYCFSMKSSMVDMALKESVKDNYEAAIYAKIETLASNIFIPFGFVQQPPSNPAELYVMRNYLLGNWKDAVMNFFSIAISEFINKDLNISDGDFNYLCTYRDIFSRYCNLNFVGMLSENNMITEANYILTQLLRYEYYEKAYCIISDEKLMATITLRLAKMVDSVIASYNFYAFAGTCVTKEFSENYHEYATQICQLPYIDTRMPMFSNKNSNSLNYPEREKLEVIYTREDR